MFEGTCEVRRVGIRPDGRAQIDMKATNGAFDWKWALSTPQNGREVLAVALVAIATNRPVYCAIAQPQVAWLALDGFFGLHK